MSRSIRCAAVLALACAALSSFVLPAGARAKHFDTTITGTFTDSEPLLGIPILPDNKDTFSGAIATDKKKCIPDRTVKVLRGSVDGELVGKTKTDKDGKWSLEAEDPGSGDYVALVTRKNVASDEQSAAGLRQICSSGKVTIAAEDT